MGFHDRGITIECPRCKKEWHLPLGHQEIDCTCHLFCPDGDKPSDCSVTAVGFSGSLGWPTGLNTNSSDEGDDVFNRTYYCSTHNKYYYKTPIILDADWQHWFSRRAPKKFRMSRGEY